MSLPLNDLYLAHVSHQCALLSSLNRTHHSVVGCADNSVLLIGPLSPLPIDAEELIPPIPPVTAAPVFPGGDGFHQSRLEDHFENYDLEEDLEAN